MGGDGTILRTVRVIAPFGVPIVGVNMGRVGFMTELRVDEALERLPDYLNGRTRVEERTMLKASVAQDGAGAPSVEISALNDVVVSRGGVARLLDVDAFVDGAPLTSYRADAVIVGHGHGQHRIRALVRRPDRVPRRPRDAASAGSAPHRTA